MGCDRVELLYFGWGTKGRRGEERKGFGEEKGRIENCKRQGEVMEGIWLRRPKRRKVKTEFSQQFISDYQA